MRLRKDYLFRRWGYDGWKPPKAPFLKINFDAALKAHFVSRSTNRSAHALAQKGWIRGKSLNLGWRDLVAIVTLEAQYNLVRGVEGEEGVVGL